METHRRRQRFSFTLDHQPGPVFPSLFRWTLGEGGGLFVNVLWRYAFYFYNSTCFGGSASNLINKILSMDDKNLSSKSRILDLILWFHLISILCCWEIKDNNLFCVCIFRKSIQIPRGCHQQWSCDCLWSRPLSRNCQRTGRIHHSNQRCWCR